MSEAAAIAACPVPTPALPRKKVAWRYAIAAGAVAASLFGGWVLISRRAPVAPSPSPPPAVMAKVETRPAPPVLPELPLRKPRRAVRKQPVLPPAEEEFTSIPYTVPLAQNERAQVWRMEMPVSELMAAGIPVTAPDPSSLARADIVVGEDGRARAFRLISVSDRESQRSIYR